MKETRWEISAIHLAVWIKTRSRPLTVYQPQHGNKVYVGVRHMLPVGLSVFIQDTRKEETLRQENYKHSDL